MVFGLLIIIPILSLSASVLLVRGPVISMDEDFVFKVSLVLLCISLLLSIIVLSLIIWLAKIHHQVDSISNGWSVYCRLTPTQKTLTTTENQPENQDICSPLPLVFFNQQAAGSDIGNSWKHINRAFAYASVRSDVDSPRPKKDETDAVLQVEDNKSDDDSKTQEQALRVSGVPVASYLQIVGNNSPIVAISTSECPIKDVKQDKRRIHVSVSSTDDDDGNYPEPLEACTQVELESMRLVDEQDLVSEELITARKNEANEQPTSLKKNDILEITKGSHTARSERVVSIEENKKESADFCTELHNVTNTKFDEQCNRKSSQEMETENKANCSIMNGTKLPNENDHGYVAVTHSDALLGLSEDSKKAMPCPSSESERVISTKPKPKGKRHRQKKIVTDVIYSDKRNRAETQKGVVPLDNVNEDKSGFVSNNCVEQMGKTKPSSATDFHQTQQHSEEKVKSSAVSDHDEDQIVNCVDQFVVNNMGTNVALSEEYHDRSVSESDGKMKLEDGTKEKYNDDCATSEDATEGNGSPGIVSQLRDLLKRKSLTDSTHAVENENKITAEDDATEAFSKDDYLTVVQENEAHQKYAGEQYYSTATDLKDPQSTADQIYSHVDDDNDDIYCEIPAAAQPAGVIHVNQDDNQYVGNRFSNKGPIYANLGLQHGRTTFNGNHAVQNEYEFAIYSNDTIDV